MPEATLPRRELVYIYNVQHRQAELDRVLGELLELDRLDFPYVLHWTKTRNTVWNPNGDLPALKKFVAADPEDRWSRLALVEALRRLDRPDEAVETLAPLPDSDPEARVERVLLAMGREDYAATEALLAGGPADHPGLAPAPRPARAAEPRRPGGGAAVPHRAWPPTRPTAWRSRAWGTALGTLGRADEARSFLEAARRHDALWALVSAPRPPRARTTPGCRTSSAWPAPRSAGTSRPAPWLRLAVRRDPLDQEGQKVLYRLEHDRPPATGTADRPTRGHDPQRLTKEP